MCYLQARIKSALWLGPTYLYSARPSHTISRNVSLRTNTDVRILYNSNGILLVLLCFPKSGGWFPKSAFFPKFPLSVLGPDETAASSFKLSVELSLLVFSKTLLLIWSDENGKHIQNNFVQKLQTYAYRFNSKRGLMWTLL
jgi:hypothetical protein